MTAFAPRRCWSTEKNKGSEGGPVTAGPPVHDEPGRGLPGGAMGDGPFAPTPELAGTGARSRSPNLGSGRQKLAYVSRDPARLQASPAFGDDQHVGAATGPLCVPHRRRRRCRLARYVLVTSRVLFVRPATARTRWRRSARRGPRPPQARRGR